MNDTYGVLFGTVYVTGAVFAGIHTSVVAAATADVAPNRMLVSAVVTNWYLASAVSSAPADAEFVTLTWVPAPGPYTNTAKFCDTWHPLRRRAYPRGTT